ncbi:MAG: hypothetical protein AB1649_30245 [Chloroflexota bacterium]
MKRNIILAAVLVIGLFLAACGNKTDAADSDTTAGVIEITTETELLVGTLKLDGTDQEVDAEQAADLLLLWQMYKSLYASDTSAQEEIDAVIRQIQDTMTPGQLNAIDAMQMTPQDIMTTMQDLGLAMIPEGDTARATPDFSSLPQDFSGGAPPADFSGGQPGGMPSGSAPQGGGDVVMPGGGEDFSQGQSATPQAWQTGRSGGGGRFTSQLVDALIKYLQEKTGE